MKVTKVTKGGKYNRKEFVKLIRIYKSIIRHNHRDTIMENLEFFSHGENWLGEAIESLTQFNTPSCFLCEGARGWKISDETVEEFDLLTKEQMYQCDYCLWQFNYTDKPDEFITEKQLEFTEGCCYPCLNTKTHMLLRTEYDDLVDIVEIHLDTPSERYSFIIDLLKDRVRLMQKVLCEFDKQIEEVG